MSTTSTMSKGGAAGNQGLSWFLAWAAIGAAGLLGLVSLLSIGVFVLVPTVVAAVLLLRAGRTGGWPGLVSGASVPLFYLAYLNRGGPGTVCSGDAAGQTCTDEYAPWPFLVVGVLLLLAGLLVRRAVARRPR